MRKVTAFVLAVLVSFAAAEKYAMVFGAADDWGNYSITSVQSLPISLIRRILAVHTPI